MHFAQYTILLLLILGFFILVYRDINGRPAKEPEGFAGVCGSIAVLILHLWLYNKAGLFSTIF